MPRKYTESRKLYECLRCGYRWFRNMETPPKKCPECGTGLWNLPKTEQFSRVAKYRGDLPQVIAKPEVPTSVITVKKFVDDRENEGWI